MLAFSEDESIIKKLREWGRGVLVLSQANLGQLATVTLTRRCGPVRGMLARRDLEHVLLLIRVSFRYVERRWLKSGNAGWARRIVLRESSVGNCMPFAQHLHRNLRHGMIHAWPMLPASDFLGSLQVRPPT